VSNKKKDIFSWEIGTKLNFEVKAKDFENAWENLQELIDIYIYESHGDYNLINLRLLQTLTNINRAAYDVGANPHKLFRHSLNIICKIRNIKSKEKLIEFAKNNLRRVIIMIPQRDYWDNRKINLALKYIREHYKENVGRETVAQMVDCSPAHLGRLFNKITGHTYKDTVLRTKMNAAKDYLEKSDLSVTKIAFEVGFEDANHFSSSFKKIIGLTPMQYRRSVISKVEGVK
jgi:AraC-like DNA-binding protein